MMICPECSKRAGLLDELRAALKDKDWRMQKMREGRRALEEQLLAEQMTRVNHYADAARVIAWIKDAGRLPANTAFTEGPERQVAYAVEDLIRGQRVK